MNKFDNDGSFLDQFMKERNDTCQQENTTKRLAALQKPIKVTWKAKGQMGGIKKKSIATLMKEGSAKKPDLDDEEEALKTLTKEETNISLKKEDQSHQEVTEVDKKLKVESHCQSTPSNQSMPGVVTKASSASNSAEKERRKRKRKSRWDKELTEDERAIASACATFTTAVQPSFQSQLTPAQQKQLKEQQQMTAVVTQIRAVQHDKKNKYEYDSDEDTEGGTWEHKLRTAEMQSTKDVAEKLTESSKGKHHIGDFLPPEEFEKFMEQVKAIKGECEPDFSDYAKNKIEESNIGYQMLKNAGWTEGQGLGSNEDGITAPVNKGKVSFDQSGVGMEKPGEVSNADDEFDTYRKRMMLAYRFRPNPLNNPRRPYY